MTQKLDLTQEQSHWFAEQIIEWAAANVGSLLVTEVGVEHAIVSVVSTDNIETAIDVIQERLSDSALDSTLITILGILGIKALAEQISKNDKTFDLETSKRVCDAYAVEHSIDIDGAGVAMLIRLMHILEHPDLPDILDHSDFLMADVVDELRNQLSSGEVKVYMALKGGELRAEKRSISQYKELRELASSTTPTRKFISLALSNITGSSMEKVAVEMRTILAARRPAGLKDLYDNDAQGG